MARFHVDQNAPGRALAALLYPAGHDVKTAGDLHMTRALDGEHLLAAARAQRILVSRDHDYLELHTAWHRWAAAWGVHPLPEHAGILIIDNHWDAQTAAHEILICLGHHAPLTNRLYQYDTRRGWQRGHP